MQMFRPTPTKQKDVPHAAHRMHSLLLDLAAGKPPVAVVFTSKRYTVLQKVHKLVLEGELQWPQHRRFRRLELQRHKVTAGHEALREGTGPRAGHVEHSVVTRPGNGPAAKPRDHVGAVLAEADHRPLVAVLVHRQAINVLANGHLPQRAVPDAQHSAAVLLGLELQLLIVDGSEGRRQLELHDGDPHLEARR
uniref:(northern house mosquito) hypothetical protein n=1 Tax=Culex pipiens TaxID=7175 RepID=A0A8D8P331_CULPI